MTHWLGYMTQLRQKAIAGGSIMRSDSHTIMRLCVGLDGMTCISNNFIQMALADNQWRRLFCVVTGAH